jgi:hypothetical protein
MEGDASLFARDGFSSRAKPRPLVAGFGLRGRGKSGNLSVGLITRTKATDRIPWQELPVRLAAKGRRSE